MSFALDQNLSPLSSDSGLTSDDLGLKNLRNFYAPYLEHEIERLFMSEVS